MTECASGCGACCDPVKLAFDPECISPRSPNYDFTREHWSTIGTYEITTGPAAGHLEWHVRCDAFDPCTRRCTVYDRRPPICSGFPWCGEAPTPDRARALELVCSYQADVRTVLPIVEVRTPAVR